MQVFKSMVCAAVLLLSGCATGAVSTAAREPRLGDHEAIEEVLSRANIGFELGDADLFAGAFAVDGVYQLDEKGPVFGYDRMVYRGRAEIRTIVSSRLDKARNTDPKTLSYDPASLRRFNRNSDEHIAIIDETTARHTSTWMVVMHTNVNIHISAIGRYADTLKKIDGKWLIVNRTRTE
ncbi:MAG: nuclear transport factor 2 family protein [Steroidobacteraceae bacterium]